jgi:hypothetical protein
MGAKRIGAVLLLAAIAAACSSKGSQPAWQPAPVLGVEDVETALFLIGDAGEPGPDDPVLAALTAQMEPFGQRAMAVFLGDNIYPLGLPDSAADDRAEMERRLAEQIDAVLRSGGRGLFVPGNHDWIRGRAGGWEAILRQERFVMERGAPDVIFLPGGGCPGPVSLDVGDRVRLIAIDTQWWLNQNPKPQHPYSSCAADAKWEVTDSLRAEARRAGDRHVVVVAHHPLATGGTHGGNFTWQDHIFPLTAAVKWLYLPLPIIGSAYPIARMSGISDQDMSGSLNKQMRDSIETALAVHPALIHAAGHEHNLQVIDGRDEQNVKHIVVSGTGYYGHLDRAFYIEGSRYAEAASGFVRVDFLHDGRARLGVITVDEEGRQTEAFSMWLETTGD